MSPARACAGFVVLTSSAVVVVDTPFTSLHFVAYAFLFISGWYIGESLWGRRPPVPVIKRVLGWRDDHVRYEPLGWRHRCPGCNSAHVINVEQPARGGARWCFDGDERAPTFTPSVNIRCGHYAVGKTETDCEACARAKRLGTRSPCWVCHYFVRAGQIQFLPDCTHALAGQTVPMQELTL